MKKFIGAICSGVAGILTLVMLSFDWFVRKQTAAGELMGEAKATGWNLITNKVTVDGHTFENAFEEFKGAYVLHRVFAIIMLVVAILLIVSAVVLLLKNLNVIKCKFNFSRVNNILLTVLAVSVLGALVGIGVMAIGAAKTVADDPFAVAMKIAVSIYPAVCAWITLAVSFVACGCGWALARKNK